MWEKIENNQGIDKMLEIMELSDPVSYPISEQNGLGEKLRNSRLPKFQNDENVEGWIYEDGAARAYIRIDKEETAGVTQCRIVNFCSTGFDNYVFENWRLAIPVMMEKIREILDNWGASRFYCNIATTKSGECIAYFADTVIWEKTNMNNSDIVNYQFEFDRKLQNKPENEQACAVCFDTNISPRAMETPILQADL